MVQLFPESVNRAYLSPLDQLADCYGNLELINRYASGWRWDEETRTFTREDPIEWVVDRRTFRGCVRSTVRLDEVTPPTIHIETVVDSIHPEEVNPNSG
jgi:hypothetical protein